MERCCCPTVNLPPTIGIDDSGERWTVTQVEGGRDPLMPLLFLIGARKGVKVCVLSSTTFTWCVSQIECDFCTDQLAEALSTVAGIWLHQGKTRCLELNRPVSRGHRRGPEVWSIDGIKVHLWGAQSSSRPSWRKESGRNPFVPDLQCVSSSPRANHSLRTMPPSASEVRSRTRRGHLVNCQSACQRRSLVLSRRCSGGQSPDAHCP